jgi:hypothetical protein
MPKSIAWVDFDEKIILNKSTPGIYSFLCKSSEKKIGHLQNFGVFSVKTQKLVIGAFCRYKVSVHFLKSALNYASFDVTQGWVLQNKFSALIRYLPERP